MWLRTTLSLLVLLCTEFHHIKGDELAILPVKGGKSFTFGNSTYDISGLKFDWYTSKLLCELEGKKLVSIESAEENVAILAELSGYSESFWISATLPILVQRDFIDDFYYWDGTGSAHGPYVNWASSYPGGSDGNKESCVVLEYTEGYQWVDVPCDGTSPHRYICEGKITAETHQKDDDAITEEERGKRFTFDGTIYEIAPLTLDWWRAKYDCKARGMKLLSIESEEENQAILANIGNFADVYRFFWMSGSDLGSEGGYYWDSTGEYLGPYLNWNEGEPNSGVDEHCTAFDTLSGSWGDVICQQYARYICELRPTSDETAFYETYETEMLEIGNGRFVFQNRTYEISKLKFDWFTAKQECAIKGMELVSIESEEENDAILQALTDYEESFWISGNDQFQYFIRGAQNYFYWDGTGHFFGPYVNWGTGQPDEQNERDLECLIMNHADNFTWYDIECSSQVLRFICEEVTVVQEVTVADDLETLEIKTVYDWDFSFENSNYWMSSDIAEWHLAKYSCESRGMELVSIETIEEGAAIEAFLNNFKSYGPSFWTSGTDLGRSDTFYWDSTGMEFGPYLNWNETQPDNGHNGDDNCVLVDMTNNWKWDDVPCYWFMRYLCESHL
ncbi:macrophage mannose receptor 1-like [Cloeon dipterum]|uniref:macrophage mannose receptor 1-like n=1 Tax=Cloeon dipterum TaxID=197152 RepID=UPI00321FBA89